ncbi:hypothetical protein B0H15DRAFT_850761 [Mycena belliarum]|uniref:Uncharacterized protein n=1 Tax=Mycena belliarum TaxID=1033014 RepID=A0AAD6U1A5_9AGAR|nr:hypothetical protein B0H15DRAFT_850761 [Mycena belliae]
MLLCSSGFFLPQCYPFSRVHSSNGCVVPHLPFLPWSQIKHFPSRIAFLGLSITPRRATPFRVTARLLAMPSCAFYFLSLSPFSPFFKHLFHLPQRRFCDVKAKLRASTQEAAVSLAGLYRPGSGSELPTLQVCPIPCRPSIPARAPALPMHEDDFDKLSPISTPSHPSTGPAAARWPGLLMPRQAVNNPARHPPRGCTRFDLRLGLGLDVEGSVFRAVVYHTIAQLLF